MNRFWSKVDKTNLCWLWIGPLDGWGYGRFKEAGRSLYAHRKAWELLIGELGQEEQVFNSCGSKDCVKPSHHFISIPYGEGNANAKLSNKQVEEIKQLNSEGFSINYLADRFNVSKTTIKWIKNGKRRSKG